MSEVICTACGTPASADQKFCGNCGTPLASGCPNCGATNPPGQRFCGTCGTNLQAGPAAAAGVGAAAPAPVAPVSPAAARPGPLARPAAAPTNGAASPTAERKLVSVLFADLVGFTPFSEGRDSEDVRETLTRYFDLATEVITRYGGTVEKFIGDAVMAVWGTPTTREDDAERAVRAALELVDAVGQLGSGIQARAGVLTGETAVTLGASNQGMVAGDLVNTAARLQSAAQPGTVLVGESTYRAASVAIAFESAGEQSLKGKASPVPAWRALRVVAERGGRNRAESLEAPFVGRDVEIRLLKDLYHATGAERRVRHVSVVGTAGIGKSRLGWEFEKYLDGIDETVLWHHGRSPAYGQGVTFWSLGEMVRGRAGLLETDDPSKGREKIAAMLDDVMPGYPNRAWVEKAMLQLLGIAGGVSSGELFGAWRAFFEALSARGTVVLVFQDVHWADSGTLDFIDHLVEWSREFPIFILSLARPELLEERPDWGTARRSFTSVYLEPLAESTMRELLKGLIPGLPEPTVQSIVSQAEGVPLYAVEIVRMLVTEGNLQAEPDGTFTVHGDVSKISVPETLTALIGARLDTLEPADRALLLDAAVLGQSFTLAGLEAVSGRSQAEIEPRLEALTRRELLRRVADARSPERGQYAFMQGLVRETAYNTLARKDRQTRHLAAARWFETLGEPELVGALAGHFLAARSLAPKGPEADALAAQARLALKAAGDRAASLGSNRQAIDFYQQALGVTVEEADEAEILELAGDIALRVGEIDDGEALLTRALEIHRGRADRLAAARVLSDLAGLLLTGRRYDQAERLLADGAREFADLGDARELLQIKSQQARLLMLTLRFDAAIPITDDVLGPAEHGDHVRLVVDTLITRGTALSNVLRWREGIAILDAAIEMSNANGLTAQWFRGINNVLNHRMMLDPRAALAMVTEGLAVARRLGDERWTQSLLGQLTFIGVRTGDWDDLIADLERQLATVTDPRSRSNPVDNLASLRAMQGLPVDEQLRELEATNELDQTYVSRMLALDTAGWGHFGAGRFDQAAEAWARAFELDPTAGNNLGPILTRVAITANDPDTAEHWAQVHWESVAHGGASEADHIALLAAIRGLRGDRNAAARDFREALRRYRELRLDIDEAIMAIDMVYALGPTDSLTADAVARARTTFAANHARAYLDQLDAALAHGAHTPAGATAGARANRKASVPAN
ncbi:MAG TPA: adenylate/guanylate cyclase domain-containing protein [Candidatus Dormibacteraeota bacterium]|nr:adenylate/guanylate cyclase domain-containing protein [Candidatus Dormibacteraeota bacterium]